MRICNDAQLQWARTSLILYSVILGYLSVILQEIQAKLEIFDLSPHPQFLRGDRLPVGMNKNNHIWIGRCIVAMVITVDDVGLNTMF